MLLGYRSTKYATTQAARVMILFNRDIRNHFPLLKKTTNLSYQEKAKRNGTIFKIQFETRYDKTMNVKISDIKVGDKMLVNNENETNLQTYINLSHLQ